MATAARLCQLLNRVRIAVHPGIIGIPAIRDEPVRIRPGQVQETLNPPNAERQVQVSAEQLPLHCPLPDAYLWNSHPKVYLPIEVAGTAICPYCGTRYRLADES